MSSSKKNNKKITKNHGLQLEDITPQTKNQRLAFEAYNEGNHLMLHGLAGTGKTFISLFLGLKEILEGDRYKTLKIIRSAVPTRDIGFLPGKPDDKTEVYELPYKENVSDLFNRDDSYSILKHHRYLEFTSTSFIRGLTFKDCIILVDEINNMNFHELDSIITRVGDNCRVIFCGDFRQSDLTRKTERDGLHSFMKILPHINNFSHIEFGVEDIVRSGLVKEYIIAKDRLGIQT